MSVSCLFIWDHCQVFPQSDRLLRLTLPPFKRGHTSPPTLHFTPSILSLHFHPGMLLSNHPPWELVLLAANQTAEHIFKQCLSTNDDCFVLFCWSFRFLKKCSFLTTIVNKTNNCYCLSIEALNALRQMSMLWVCPQHVSAAHHRVAAWTIFYVPTQTHTHSLQDFLFFTAVAKQSWLISYLWNKFFIYFFADVPDTIFFLLSPFWNAPLFTRKSKFPTSWSGFDMGIHTSEASRCYRLL